MKGIFVCNTKTRLTENMFCLIIRSVHNLMKKKSTRCLLNCYLSICVVFHSKCGCPWQAVGEQLFTIFPWIWQLSFLKLLDYSQEYSAHVLQEKVQAKYVNTFYTFIVTIFFLFTFNSEELSSFLHVYFSVIK